MLGKFLVKDTKYLKDLVSVAQKQKVYSIEDVGIVGSNADNFVSVVELKNEFGESYLTMITRNRYEMMDFTEETKLKAYNNFTNQVKKATGAYSNKFNLASTGL